MRRRRGRHSSARGTGYPLDVDDTPEKTRARERQERQFDRGRKTARRRDASRDANFFAIQLGQAVNKSTKEVWVRMLRAVVPLVRGRIAQPKIARHVDNLHARRKQLWNFRGRDLVWEREKRDVAARHRVTRREILES